MRIFETVNLRRSLIGVTSCVLVLLAATAAKSQVCSHTADPAFYSQGNYTIREVRLESPIDFLHAISSQLNALRSQLPVQPGKIFRLVDLSTGKDIIDKALDDEEKNADPRSRIRVVLGKISNCNEAGPTPQLDVLYRVFTTNYNAYLTHTWELKSAELERPATTAATTQARGFLTVKPFIDYNRARQLHAGGLLRLQLPGIFDHLEISSSGSSNSDVEAFQLSGSSEPETGAISRVDYRIAYTHENLPAGANRLREGTLRGQAFAATKAVGKHAAIFRVGVSFEGGNQQTDIAPINTSAVEDSGYGGLKTYLGTTLRTKKYSLAASYGLQLGTSGANTNLDFIKHLFDAGFTARWLPGNQTPGDVHKLLALESEFTAGVIQEKGPVPVAQRFFGGNHTHNFIEGDTWQFRSQPFIRSVPENRLASRAALGGNRFVSFNVTLAKAIWGRAIIPKDIATDPDFLPALESSKVSARNILVATYLSKLPAFETISTHMDSVGAELVKLRTMLDTLPAELPSSLPEEISEPLEENRELVSDATKIIGSIIQDKKNLPSKLRSLLKEENSTTCLEDDSCSQLTSLRATLRTMQPLLLSAGFAQASVVTKQVEESLSQQQPQLARELDNVDTSAAVRMADADMKLVDTTLDSFINELNWIAVSPVAIFDAARVWPDRFGFRYAVGGGMRLSLVNFNVTVGYAVNPQRHPGDSRGALFFTMDVTDIFK
jgi:hypothetical protein